MSQCEYKPAVSAGQCVRYGCELVSVGEGVGELVGVCLSVGVGVRALAGE